MQHVWYDAQQKYFLLKCELCFHVVKASSYKSGYGDQVIGLKRGWVVHVLN
jgi:hypothetical protein